MTRDAAVASVLPTFTSWTELATTGSGRVSRESRGVRYPLHADVPSLDGRGGRNAVANHDAALTTEITITETTTTRISTSDAVNLDAPAVKQAAPPRREPR